MIVTNYHSILARWRNHVSRLLNVHGVNDVGQTELHATERMVPELSALEDEMAIENLKRHKSPGIDQIPAELIKAGVRIIRSENHNIFNSIWNKEELPEEWKGSIIVPIYKKGDKKDCINYRGISLFSNYVQNFIQHHTVQVNSICRKLLGIISMDFDTIYRLLILYSAFVKYLKKYGNKMKQCISYL